MYEYMANGSLKDHLHCILLIFVFIYLFILLPPFFGLISHKVVSQMGKKTDNISSGFLWEIYLLNEYSNMQINRMAGRNDAY